MPITGKITAMKLKLRFLLLMTLIFIGFMLITWYLSLRWMNQVNDAWGQQFSQRQVIFDKYRILLPLIPEIALARKMASDPAIIQMALHDNNPGIRDRGINVLENYRLHFKDHNYFAAIADSGNYYFNDAKNQYQGKELRYVLSPDNPNDSWFYATVKDDKDFQINVNPDVHLNVTKVWINVLVRSRGKILGVVGTGINLKHFLKESVSVSRHGIHNLIIDKDMAIQLDTDPALIDYMSVAKSASQHIKVGILLKNQNDIRKLQLAMKYLEKNPNKIETFWVDYAGTKHLLGVAYLPEIGWYDLTFMDVHNVMLIEHNMFMPFILGVAFLIALIIMAQALHRWVMKPISALQISSDKIQQGDFNFVPRVQGAGEIRMLAESFSRMAKYVNDTNHELENKVRERTDELQHLTEIDPLTGLLNRRGMTDRLDKEIARHARQGSSFGLLLLDIDYFKRINDNYGHAAGDLALCEVAVVIQSLKREYDYAARWGGDEFLILLPDCDRLNLLAISKRIHDGIGGREIRAVPQSFFITVSIGAHYSDSTQTLDEMLQKVDEALYAAKDGGRDQVHFSASS